MRYSFNDLIDQINARLISNSSGGITAAVMRSMLIDFVESVRGASSYMTRTGAGLSCALTTTYQTVAGLMPNVVNSATDEIEGLTTTQTITAKIPGYYRVQFDLTAEAASNVELQVAILVDGVEYPFCTGKVQMLGAGKPLGVNNTAEVHLNANQNVKLGLRIESGTDSVIVGPVGIGCQFIPSRTS